jgi:hypothetical protein
MKEIVHIAFHSQMTDTKGHSNMKKIQSLFNWGKTIIPRYQLSPIMLAKNLKKKFFFNGTGFPPPPMLFHVFIRKMSQHT